MSATRFLREFLSRPATIGAIAPSSTFLAKTMIESLPLSQATAVAEYGPGTGIFTEQILREISADTKFFAIEINPHTGATRASQGVDPMPNALVVTAMLLFPGQDEIVGDQIRKTLKDPKSVGTYDPAARPNSG